MRTVLLATALLAITVAAPAQQRKPARDWSITATRTATGSFVIGNPQARTKLVEYASYTCPHCADFANQSAPVLKDRMIRSGAVSLEFRHVVFNALDLGAAMLARCTGPGFATTTTQFYRTQDQWLARGAAWGQANAAKLVGQPPARQLRAMVNGAGLVSMTRLSSAAVDKCLADSAEIDRVTAMAGEINSTPTFFLNGKRLPSGSWPDVQQQLRAAGVR